MSLYYEAVAIVADVAICRRYYFKSVIDSTFGELTTFELNLSLLRV